MITADDAELMPAEEYDAELIIEYLTFKVTGGGSLDLGPPGSARMDGSLAASNEAAWPLVLDDSRFTALGLSPLDARMMAEREMATRAKFDPRKHPRVAHGEHGGQWARTTGGLSSVATMGPGDAALGADVEKFLSGGMPEPSSEDPAADIAARLKARTAERLAGAMKSTTADLVAATADRDQNIHDAWAHRDDPQWAFAIHSHTGFAWAQHVGDVEDDWLKQMLERQGYDTVARGGSPEVDGLIRRAATAHMVRQWSLSASDDEIISRAIQEAARREFGMDAAELPEPRIGGTDRYTQAEFDQHEGVYRDFVRTEYDLTQADLKKAGITSLWLHRGFHWDSARTELPPWAAEGPGEKDMPPLRPLSSWSARETIAADFAGGGLHRSAYHVGRELSAAIPADRVVATPATGAGSLDEAELIVMATPGKAWSRVARERP